MQKAPHVLVTGGAGYVGSHACKALSAAGFQPVVYDNLSKGHRWAVKWGPLEVGAMTDEARLREVISAYAPVAAMHFAAQIEVGESVKDPAGYYANNLGGTMALISVLRDSKISNIVFSSSAAVYGEPEQVPIVESAPKAPINPYGRAKHFEELMLLDAEQAYGIRSVALRYFNAAGADPEGQIGEAHSPETHLLPRALDAASGDGSALHIYGTDYPTPDGTAIRDYIHVTDLAEAHLLALRFLLNGGASVALNLGTGQGASVKEIVDTIEAVTGRPVPVIEAPRRSGDPPVLVADTSRAGSVLGFQSRYSEIRTIIETAWAWHKRYQGDKKHDDGGKER